MLINLRPDVSIVYPMFNMHSKTADEFLFQRFWCGIIRPMFIFVVLTSLDVFALLCQWSVQSKLRVNGKPLQIQRKFSQHLAFLALT